MSTCPIDVHVDSNHRWETDRVLEVDAYAMVLTESGTYETDTSTPLASVEVPAGDYCEDVWIDTRDRQTYDQLPPHARAAYDTVVALARKAGA